jgi:hypothetical protein
LEQFAIPNLDNDRFWKYSNFNLKIEEEEIISISDNTTSINSIKSTISEYDKKSSEEKRDLNEDNVNNIYTDLNMNNEINY